MKTHSGRVWVGVAVSTSVGFLGLLAGLLSDEVLAADIRLQTLRPDGGSASDWRSFYLTPDAATSNGNGQLNEGATSGPLGNEWTTGVYLPLSQQLRSVVESTSATGTTGASERSVLGQIGTRLGDGWGVQAGLRHSEIAFGASEWQPYGSNTAFADLGSLTFERHWDRYRGAYTVYGSRAEGGALAAAHRWQVDWFYSERSSVGFAYTTGRQLELQSSFATLAPVEVSNMGVVGEHWLTPAWAIHYRALVEDRGLDGLQPEIQFGVRSRF